MLAVLACTLTTVVLRMETKASRAQPAPVNFTFSYNGSCGLHHINSSDSVARARRNVLRDALPPANGTLSEPD